MREHWSAGTVTHGINVPHARLHPFVDAGATAVVLDACDIQFQSVDARLAPDGYENLIRRDLIVLRATFQADSFFAIVDGHARRGAIHA